MTVRHSAPLTAALGLLLSGSLVASSLAQQPGSAFPRPGNTSQNQGTPARTANTGVARPEAEPLRVEQLDPQLESILRSWELESSKIKVMHGTHYRQEFNNVFSVEKRAKGEFYFEAPDKGRFDMDSVDIKDGQKSLKVDPNTRQPYQLASSNDQKWICTGNEILIINPVAKEFELFPIPEQMRGEKISQSPLPFLFGMKADEAKRRFELRLHGQNDNAWFIDAIPRTQMDSQNYKHARIVLHKQSFVPMKVYLIDPAGSIMTEYTFVDVKVNPRQNVLAGLLPGFKDANPFQPKLTGYKLVQQPPPVAENGNAMPEGQRPDPRRQSVVPINATQPGSRVPLPRPGQ